MKVAPSISIPWFLLPVMHMTLGQTQDASDISCTTLCDVDGVAETGQPSVITCHFSQSPRDRKLPFYIFRTRKKVDKQRGDLVLDCPWDDKHENPECAVTEGFQYDEMIGKNISLHITRTNKTQHEAEYQCEIDRGGILKCDPCSLIVVGPTNTPGSDEASVNVGAIVGSVITIILLVICIFALYILCQRGYLRKFWNQDSRGKKPVHPEEDDVGRGQRDSPDGASPPEQEEEIPLTNMSDVESTPHRESELIDFEHGESKVTAHRLQQTAAASEVTPEPLKEEGPKLPAEQQRVEFEDGLSRVAAYKIQRDSPAKEVKSM